tara:strand:- start:493 stop:687 length:195 start_codon:yes stop_codon:yes gene_type:complete
MVYNALSESGSWARQTDSTLFHPVIEKTILHGQLVTTVEIAIISTFAGSLVGIWGCPPYLRLWR